MTTDRDAALVSAEWIQDHLDEFAEDEPEYRLVEVNVDTSRHNTGHIPGAVSLDWNAELQDPERFDVASPEAFAQLVGQYGIEEDTTVVLYGDLYNWFAAYAYWLFTYYGHNDVRLLDGGWRYWITAGKPVADRTSEYPAVSYAVPAPDTSIRVDRPDVEAAVTGGNTTIVDVRAPPEYRGDVLSPPGWNEGVQRGGHIPGAENVPWSQVVNADGRFKSNAALQELFSQLLDEQVVVYCRIGERSAMTWFALHELLGKRDVTHYYGSWVEWGNTVGTPIETE
ncbi:sulfurtransferase [Halorubrum sp. AD140]|uniref:sulfurtransferase n=1 Tax=Halorubrum sp. AD140 TaxID=3050073 RepID=UPI002ACC8BBB|nr:sulfurtransferase [Halorubrum sp. AD140]MDZ5811939.1 sulfurtransferase [Halorubrum sp. AD140]